MELKKDVLRGRFTAWMKVVVKRAKIDYIRRQNRHITTVPIDLIAEDEICLESDCNLIIDTDNFTFSDENVILAFSTLSLMRQKILTLLFVQGKTVEQIAEIFGCSTKHIFNEKSIALKQLRECLRRI